MATIAFGGLSILLVCFPADITRIVAYTITTLYIIVILAYDYVHTAHDRQKTVFYHVMAFEVGFLAFGVLFFFLEAPEVCCRRNKFVNIYFCSYIILTVCIMSFLYELQNCLTYLIKLNEGSLS